MSSYVGVTIGPIFDTISLAHTPAAMWYASNTFSKLTETICRNIFCKDGDMEILSPYYDGTEYTDGVGRYHDRVIVKNANLEEIKEIVKVSIGEICDMICQDLGRSDKATKEFLEKYFQVRCVCLPKIDKDEDALLKLGGLLDSIEQMVSPNVENTGNPFVKLFKGEETANDLVKKRVNTIQNSQLKSGDRIKSIPEIAGTGKIDNFKRYNYYAIVEADGDNMGKLIGTLNGAQLGKFSAICFDYAEKAAKAIGEYGGMTIYAGGDDLMFLAPVYKDEKNNIFTLCRSIGEMLENALEKEFDTNVKKLKEDGKVPAVSFGVAIRRKKFPLYEAWQSSVDALEAAKSEEVGKKCLYIDMQKGSGQAIKLAVPFDRFDEFNAVFETYNKVSNEQMFKSLIYNMGLWEKVLENTKTEATFKNVFKNMFDNAEQKKLEEKVDKIAEKIFTLVNNNEGRKIRTYGKRSKTDKNELGNMKVIEAILRLSKFMIEEGGERE